MRSNPPTWPKSPAYSMLRLRRTFRTGLREQWTLVGSRDALTLTCQTVHEDGSVDVRSATHATLTAVFDGEPTLLQVGVGAVHEYVLDDSLLPAEFVAHLAAAEAEAEEAAGWPASLAEPWAERCEWLADLLPELEWVHRWAMVNGQPVSTVRTAAGLLSVLVAESEEDLVGVRTLAESVWFSEGGGAPVSWDGRNKLILLRPGWAYERQSGDEGNQGRIIPFPSDPPEVGEEVASWTSRIGAQVAAALALEPFDPQGEVTGEQRQDWAETVAAVTLSFTTDLGEQEITTLRRRLQGDELYRRVADGLSHPGSPAGQRLYAALTGSLGGATGPLMWGYWDES